MSASGLFLGQLRLSLFPSPQGIALAVAAGLLVDLALGDPVFRLHPVRLVGDLASACERFFRSRFRLPSPPKGSPIPAGFRPDGRARLAGTLAWASVLSLAVLGAGLALALAALAASYIEYLLTASGHRGAAVMAPALVRALGGGLVVWASIAPTDLAAHAMRVARGLGRDESEHAAEPLRGRAAVAMLVGRKVDALDGSGVARAAVESVAESSVDGVAAPLFWAALLGPVGAFAYRAINTMDSMFGHKDGRYLDFGRCSALADDAANWAPARLSSVAACLGAPFVGASAAGALAAYRKYRFAHASPNAGHPESAYAGAFGLRLAGPVAYPEGIAEKPWINPAGRDPGSPDIAGAVRLMYAQTFVSVAAFLGLRLALSLAVNLIPR